MSAFLKFGVAFPLIIAAVAFFVGSGQKEAFQWKTDKVAELESKHEKRREEFPQLERDTKRTISELESEIDRFENEAVRARTGFAALQTKARWYELSPSDLEALIALPSSGEVQSRIQALARRHLPSDNRPYSGHVLFNRTGMSQFEGGYLELKNGLDEDAYVKLIYGERAIAGFYVRSNNTFKFRGIPEATFYVVFATGFGWDSTANDFRRGRQAERYDDDFNYKLYEGFSLTLHKVALGNATTTPISPSLFDSYQQDSKGEQRAGEKLLIAVLQLRSQER